MKKVEVRHYIEIPGDKEDPYFVFRVVAIDDNGQEEEIETADFYPTARRAGKEYALKHGAKLFEVDHEDNEREIPLPGPFPSLYAEVAPTNTPDEFSIQERSTGTEIIFPAIQGGFHLPEILATLVFVLAVSGIGFVFYRLASHDYSMLLIFVGLVSGVALLVFNPLNIWTAIQPHKNEIHLGHAGIHHRNTIGKTVHEEKIAWSDVEDIIVSKDTETDLWDIRVLTEDDEYYLWTAETREDLDWLKQTICYAARQYYR